jgi:eukaryotic-like serine/threonine-protein kinase
MKKRLEAYMSSEEPVDKDIAGESHSTVEFLMRRMRHKGDLPAFSEHIIEINSKLSSLTAITFSSAGDLSKIILKDFSLTNKLLKVVNSSLYATLSGKVATVSKAVLLLGFEKMRMIAVTLMIFEHLQNKTQATELKEAAIGSFMSAQIAMDIADNMKLGGREEVFICAMLHSLGKMLVICYLPEEHSEIKNRMTKRGFDEATASQSVLGITYNALGMAVSRTWNFPDKIVRSMEVPPAGVIPPPRTEYETLRNLSSYSNDLFNRVMNTQEEGRTAALTDLSMRYNNSIPLSVQQMESILTSTANKIDSYSDIIRIDRKNSAFMKKQLQPSQSPFREQNEEKDAGNLQRQTVSALHPAVASQPSGAIKERQAAILADGLHEITAVMNGSYNLGDVIYMILETMYRGFEFNRVIFCLMDATKSKMAARFGLGEDVDEILKHFQFLTGRSTDIFNVGISQAKGIIIDDAADPKIFRSIPEWYQQIVGASSFLILPLEVRGVCIGMFYADKKEKGRLLTEEQLNHMENLCEMAIEAITHKQPQ